MRALYKNQMVDYNDGNTEFVREFNDQIHFTGAIVYNYRDNTYQFIRRFEEIAFINELYPCFFKVKPSRLPRGIDIEMAYDFDPAFYAEDDEILSLWKEAVEEGQPYYEYDEDGEIYEKEIIPMSAEPTKHTVWILNEDGRDYIDEFDSLILLPMIKLLPIAKECIRNYTEEPFENEV